MTLIIENGSIVANANSYVTLAELRVYASSRGIVLSSVDADLEVMLIKAMDYLEAQRARYQGEKTDYENQELQWPRYPVSIDRKAIDSNAIPKELKKAQMQLVIEVHNGIDLQPTTTEAPVIEDTVGPLTTKYSEKFGDFSSPSMDAVNSLLEPLFSSCGQGFMLSSLRI